MREEEQTQGFPRQILIIGDVLMMLIIAQFTSGIILEEWVAIPGRFQLPVVLVIATYLIISMLARSLTGNRKRTWATDYTIVIAAWVGAAITLTTFFFFSKTGVYYSRLWFGTWLSLTPIMIVLGRFFLSQVLALFGVEQAYRQHALLISDGSEAAKKFADAFGLDTSAIDIVGSVHIPADEADKDAKKAAMDSIKRQLEKGEIDTLLVAPTSNQTLLEKLHEELKFYSIDLLTCPSNYRPNMIVADALIMNGMPLLLAQSRPIRGEAQILKALEDRVLGTILLIAFAPLMALIALAVKLDSRGPVFFVQNRHGFNHDEFRMYKFRSMYSGDDGKRQATRNDDRITRVGRWLRRTSLDELPQLLNVVMGHMSLVGPRPHPAPHRDMYSKQIDSWLARHRVKPGITGWAQINGYRGEIENQDELIRRVEHDLYYIDNWSVLFDLKILFATPVRGFIHPKAY